MIWSTPAGQLKVVKDQLERAGMLRHTELLDEQLERIGQTALDAQLSFFEVPPSKHIVDKLVIPYVHIDDRGFVDTEAPRIYGVTKRPNTYVGYQPSEVRSREVHVYAEDTSLQNGLFTPYGRARAEDTAVELMPEIFQEEYVRDRITHIHALEAEVVAYDGLRQSTRDKITRQLELGIDTLEARLP